MIFNKKYTLALKSDLPKGISFHEDLKNVCRFILFAKLNLISIKTWVKCDW